MAYTARNWSDSNPAFPEPFAHRMNQLEQAVADASTGSAGAPADGSVTNIKVAANAAIAVTKLALPGGSANYLREDGTWHAPASGAAAVSNGSGGTMMTGVHWGGESDFALLKSIGYEFSVLNLNPDDSSNWASRFANAKAAGIKLIAGCWPPPYTPTGDVWAISAGGVSLLNFYEAHADQIVALFVFNEPLYINNITGVPDSNGAHSAANLRGLRNAIRAVWPGAKIYHDLGWPSEWAPGGDFWAAYPGIGNKYADFTGVCDYAGVYDYPFEPGGYQRARALWRLEKESSFVANNMGGAVTAWLNQSHAVTGLVYPTQDQILDWNNASRNALPAGSIISMYVWEQDIYDDQLKNHPEQWSSTVGAGAPGPSPRVLNLAASPYGVSPTATAAANAAAIQKAFTDAAVEGVPVYLPANHLPYPCNQITLPNKPITFFGDGPFVSVLQCPASYASPVILGSSTGVPTTGTFGSSTSNFYKGDRLEIVGIGIDCRGAAASGNKGIYLPGQSGIRMSYALRQVYVFGCFDDGITIDDSGPVWGHVIEDCCVYNAQGRGFNLCSDFMISDCVAANCGFEGFYFVNRTSVQIDNCKAYSSGTTTHARGIGFYFNSPNAGVVATNLDAQDNFAEGMVIKGSKAVVQGFIADNNSQDGSGNYPGLRLEDVHNVHVEGYISTDRLNNGPSTHQTVGLKVVNTGGTTNYGNRVVMVQEPTDEGAGLPVMSTPVDAASDLSGTEVIVGGSGGGSYTFASASTITPDPYKGQTNRMIMTANVSAVNAPANKHHGCVLRLVFVQDGTGTRTLPTFNAIYVMPAISNTGNTAGKYWEATFQYDAVTSKWVSRGAPQQWAF